MRRRGKKGEERAEERSESKNRERFINPIGMPFIVLLAIERRTESGKRERGEEEPIVLSSLAFFGWINVKVGLCLCKGLIEGENLDTWR
jgi:hypothetical protein